MQQRQLRLGDTLDDYCPRERRVTNHAIVAMVGSEVKQTRCTTCESEHEYKQAKMPRLRRKTQTPAALAAQGFAAPPKLHEPEMPDRPAAPDAPFAPTAEATEDIEITGTLEAEDDAVAAAAAAAEGQESAEGREPGDADAGDDRRREEGPVHRPLIRASLPRPEGQPPPSRPATDFTIRQPAGRNRFRPRHQQGGQFQGNRGNGSYGGSGRGGGGRQGGRPPQGGTAARHQRHHDAGRKRSR